MTFASPLLIRASLAFAFLFGPIGYLAFEIIKAASLRLKAAQ